MAIKHIHYLRHSFDFFILLAIIVLGLWGISIYRFDKFAQIVIVCLMSAGYLCWGIFHHHHDGNLTKNIFLEYISIAALVGAFLSLFLLRI